MEDGSYIRALVAEAERKVGSRAKLAAEWGISVQYIRDVLSGYRNPGKSILKALGYERVVLYRKRGSDMEYGFVDGMIDGMERSQAARERGDVGRVFDWDKAARRIIEEQAFVASAGLQNDWEYTGGLIWSDGKPVPKKDTYTYLASLWATPELNIDGNIEACFIFADQTEWDSGTYWPESALAILRRQKAMSR